MKSSFLLFSLLLISSLALAKSQKVFEECLVSGYGNIIEFISVPEGAQIVNGCPLFIKSTFLISDTDAFTIKNLISGNAENCWYGAFSCKK